MPRSARALLALLPVLALTGCGGSEQAAAPSSAPATAAAPAPDAASAGPPSASPPTATPSPRGNRPAADYPDACRLLTRQDVQAVYPGKQVSAASPQRGSLAGAPLPKPVGCSYDVQGGRVSGTVTLRVGTLVYDAQHDFDVGKTVDAPHLRPLPIGDEAYDPGRVVPTTVLLVDGLELQVEVLDGQRRAAQPLSEALARRVAQNVQGSSSGVSS